MTTGTFTVDTAGEWLIADSFCTNILVGENAQTGTAAWTYAAPFTTSPPVTVPPGALRTFTGIFWPGARVAFIAAVTGSMTFAKQETINGG